MPLRCRDGKLEAIQYPEHASETPDWENFGKIKAMVLLEYAPEMPGWETVGKLKAMN